jgi:anti-sigma regulatory factor (Ser/Thr protein kinase)
MMPARMRMRFAGRQSALNRLLDRFHAFAADQRLPAAVERDAHLVLDEIVSNIFRHGRMGRRAPTIDVQAAVEDGVLRIAIVDDGRAFDPLASPPPAIDAPPSDRPIGGLGIHLTTKLMDRVEYRRTKGKNQMIFERSTA